MREFGDVVGILVVGAGIAAAAAFNLVNSPQTLSAVTLGVLAVLALSIFKDRITARAAKSRLDHIHTDIAGMSKTFAALQDGRPYHVVQHTTRWDIEKNDGSIVYVTRMKKLIFDQSEIVAIYDFAGGDGERDYEYSVGKIVGEPFPVDGTMAHIVALGDVYSRGDSLDLGLKRTVKNGFPTKREAVSVLTRDITSQLRMEVLWPLGRPPSAIKIVTTSASLERTKVDVFDKRTMEEGRTLYVYEVDEPEKGGTTRIEWEWPSV